MKRSRITAKLLGAAALGLASFGCSIAPQTVATIPTVTPPAATPTPANMLGVAPGGGPPGPTTVWQQLGVGKQQLESCRRQMCASPAGQLMASVVAPMSKLSGGLIPPFCSPIPTVAELLDPGVIGANSKVKMDKANAEARKKAVEELAGVDCHYWPEAEDALIGALRADRNECVRHTAALALQRGCCCTKKTIESLSICVSGSEADGHPCEKSPRVRAAAAVALQQCLERSCCPTCPIPEGAIPVMPVEEKKDKEEKPKGETPKLPTGAATSQVAWVKHGPETEEVDEEAAAKKASKAYYNNIAKTKTMAELLAKAKHCLETMAPLPLDLSIPVGSPDYEAAGVRTMSMMGGAPRQANILDMITGKSDSKATKMMLAPAATPTVATNAVPTPVTAPAVAKTVAPTQQVSTATAEPPVAAKPVEKVKTAEIKPAMVVPVAIPVPAPMPAAKVETAAPVSPLAMPILTPSAPPAPMPARIVEAPKPGQAKVSNASRVMKMLEESSDLIELTRSINALTAMDLKEQPKLTPTLLKAAEYPSDSGLRVACLKAVARGRSKSLEVMTSLERLSHDADPAVAAEAARVVQDLKATH